LSPKTQYANAAEILPSDLVRQIQKYHCGLIWVPSPSNFYQERKDLVIGMFKRGIPTKEIAALAGVSTRRVNQVLRANRHSAPVGGK
jgi:hypothetical protein